MSSSARLKDVLKALLFLLEEEKRILIRNEAEKLADLVLKKEELAGMLETLKEAIPTAEELSLLQSVKILQETNFLLTRQALSFQEKLLSAVSRSNTSKYNTYSAQGSLQMTKEISIIDQSV